MLKSRYHCLLLGLSPWSLIHGHLLARAGKDVLVVDDTRLNSKSSQSEHIGPLERMTLIEMGKQYGLSELTQIESYLRPGPFQVHLTGRQLFLGGQCLDNLREIARKLPELMTPAVNKLLEGRTSSDVNQDIDHLCQSWLSWFSTQASSNKEVLPWVRQAAPWLMELDRQLGEWLKEEYVDERSLLARQLCAATLAATSDVHLPAPSAHERILTLLRLIAPRWILRRDWLEKDLLRPFLAAGGHFKRTSIQHWQFHQGKLYSVLLASYEGVISQERTLLYAHSPEVYPFKLHFQDKIYQGLTLTSQGGSSRSPSWQEMDGDEVIYTQQSWLGSDHPFLVLSKVGETRQACWPIPLMQSSKPEFFLGHAKQCIREVWPKAFANDSLEWLEFAKLKEHGQLWVELNPIENKKNQALLLPRQLQVLDRAELRPLSGLEYWGPHKLVHFGLLGQLSYIRQYP